MEIGRGGGAPVGRGAHPGRHQHAAQLGLLGVGPAFPTIQRDPPVPSSAATEFVLVEDVRVNLEEVTIYDHLGFQIQPLPCRLPGAADDIKIACWEMRAIAMLKKRKICIQIQKFGQ
ncbi:nuclear pore membrane glycoprotein 210-like isoform X1 [Aotus nancymaae]|uniref:nuclear pore membrane glycoprotein 210-like isoform X1 n=1 Tax=Aotus nancymaae TaxID=37293 RepID=UPI0030FEDBE1